MGTTSTGESRQKIGFWIRWLDASKKAAKRHSDDSKAAYKEYEFGAADPNEIKTSRGYPLYWAACQTLEPAYYSKTPKVVSTRKYGIENPEALTMSLIAERLGQFLLDNGHFDDGMVAARADFINAAKATVNVIYTAEMEPQRVPLMVAETGGYYETSPDQMYDGEVKQDDEGYYYEKNIAREESQRIFLAPCPFDEVLHTPEAKTNAEITEIAYKFSIDKETAEAKFNPDGTKALPYKKSKIYSSESDDSEDDAIETPGEVLEGWEIYCSHSKAVYWVCEDYKSDFVHQEPDPYGLRKFFPSPGFILQNKPRKSMYPTPTYVYLEGTCNQLHKLYDRIFSLIESIRRRAIVLGASPELITALNSLGGQEFISTGEVQDILDKGGIANMIQFVPVKELVDALAEATQLEEHFKNNFYEWFGVPDILRGVSDPTETAAAQGIKSDAAHDRFKYNKKQMVDLGRDAAEMMLDLALKVFSDNKIAQICGYQFLEPEHHVRFLPCLYKLKNDEERIVSIDFETDSTSFRDEARELQRQSQLSQVVIQGLATIGGMQNLEFASVALQSLLSLVAANGGSKEYEEPIKKAVSELVEKRKQPQPPPPDVEMLKVQVAQQKTQGELQIRAQEMQLEASQNQLEAQIAARELAQKDFELQLSAIKTQSEAQINQFTAQTTAALDKALLTIEQQRVQIESFKAQVQAQETLLEEVRLRQEADAAAFAQIKGEAEGSAPKAPSTPPVTLNLVTGDAAAQLGPKRRVITPIRNEMGDIVQAHIEDMI